MSEKTIQRLIFERFIPCCLWAIVAACLLLVLVMILGLCCIIVDETIYRESPEVCCDC